MKKTKRWLALILSSCMLFTSTGMGGSFAEDIATNTDATSNIEETYEEDNVEEEITTETNVEEVTTEAVTEETEENTSEEETVDIEEKEVIPTFDTDYGTVSTDGLDFSSQELLIATNDASIFTADTEVVSEYNGIYLTHYDSVEHTKNAYTYYYNQVDLIEVNSEIKASTNDEEINDEETTDETNTNETIDENDIEISNDGHGEADLSNINESDDSFSVLNDISVTDYTGYIALIDTGASYDNVKKSVSMLSDDGIDYNGHGTSMAKTIYETNSEAKVLSIKALDNNAVGTVQDVYAAIEYAVESNVSVINLSMSSIATADSDLLRTAISDATNKGIKVVASAGNRNSNASYYTPGNIESVFTIGACDTDGNKIESSNYGTIVDYYVVADSTSTAAAKFSAYVVKSIDYAVMQSDVFINSDADYNNNENTISEDNTEDEVINEEKNTDENNSSVNNDEFDKDHANGNAIRTIDIDKTAIRQTDEDNILLKGAYAWEDADYARIDGLYSPYTYTHGSLLDGYPYSFTSTVTIRQTSGSTGSYSGYAGEIVSLSTPPYGYDLWVGNVATGPMVACHSHLKGINLPAPGNVGDEYTITNAVWTYVGNDGDWELYYTSSQVDGKPNAQNLLAVVAIKKMPWYYAVGIHKTGENGEGVPATFGIYNNTSKTKRLGTITTGSDGYGWTKLLDGNSTYDSYPTVYVYEESSSIPEYNNNTNKGYKGSISTTWSYEPFTSFNYTTATGSYTNVKTHTGVGIYKYEVATGVQTPISGAKFDIYLNGSNTVYRTLTTNDAGQAVVEVPYGTTSAIAKETYVDPDKYVLDTRSVNLTLTSVDAPISITNVQKTSITNTRAQYAYVTKKSSNTDCTKDNPNYSLNGATYKIFTTAQAAQNALDTLNYNGAIMSFTVDSDGNSSAQKVPDEYLMHNADKSVAETTLYAVESKAGEKGYLRSNNVIPVKINNDNNSVTKAAKWEMEDVPINDPINLTIEKSDKLYAETKSLEGTEFTINFYAQDISTIRSAAWLKANCTPDQTEKLYVNENGIARIDHIYPRGFITIEETSLPEGYVSDNDFTVYLNNDSNKEITDNLVFITDGMLIQNDTNFIPTTWYPWNATTYNELATKGENVDTADFKLGIINPTATRADIQLTKMDEVNDEPMANVKFRIKNKDTGEVHYIYTDENGFATTKVTSYGSHVNYYDNVADYDGTDDATVWFGQYDGKNIDAVDGYSALIIGNYTIKEMSCAANKGRQLEPEHEFTITDADKNTIINVFDPDAQNSENKLWNTVKPTIKTTAIVKETSDVDNPESKTLGQASSIIDDSNVDWTNQTIIDTITMEKLRADTTYTLLSELMIVDKDGNVTPYLDKDGNPYKRVKTFTTSKDYDKSIYEINLVETMDLDSVDPTGLEEQQKSLVVYESLYYGDYDTVAKLEKAIEEETVLTRYENYDEFDDMDFFPVEHKDKDDTFQTVKPGDIHTTINDSVSGDKIAHTSTETKLTDKISYSGLTPGLTYTITGTLQVKEGTKWSHIKYDPKNPDADEDGYVYYDEVETEDNTDDTTDDGTQPDVTNDDTNDETNENDTTERTDKVYTLRDAEGNPVTATAEFVPESSDGYVYIDFEFDSTGLEGKNVVAFEELKYKDIVIATHADIEDEDETVHYPDFKTTTWNSNITVVVEGEEDSAQEVEAVAEGSSFTDTIHFHNLLANRKYIAKGTLMDKETGEPMKDATGKVIYAETVFNSSDIAEVVVTTSPDAFDFVNEDGEVLDMASDHANYLCDGDIDVVFKDYDFTNVAGKTGVVFEEIYMLSETGEYDDNGVALTTEIAVGEHKDIKDVDQFVYFIDMHTKAVDSTTKIQVVPENTDTSIIDTVTYSNVIPGKKYTLNATLKVTGDTTGKYKDGDDLLDKNGKPIIATIDFVPEKANGTVDVEIKFNTNGLVSGTNIVVFEDMYNSYGIQVATHSDLNDKDQTVKVPKGRTTALSDESKDHNVSADKDMKIVDTIYYENLVPGKEYTAVGTVYRKDTEKPLEKDGKAITVTVKFTPTEPNGTVEVPFTIDTSDLATKKLVFFEDVKYGNVTIFTHHDLSDEDQTVTVNMILAIDIAKADKDDIKYFLKGAEITIYNQDGTVAKDINGKECVGTTDKDGHVEFEVLYKENNTYYAKETKAPNGYSINNDKFEITASGTKNEKHKDIIKITILDTAISIPPKTGDILLVVFGLITLIGVGGVLVYRKKKTH